MSKTLTSRLLFPGVAALLSLGLPAIATEWTTDGLARADF